MSLADLGKGCSNVMLTAELKGPETEEFYCPSVEWVELGSKEAQDCPPFERRHQCMEDQKGCGVIGFRLDPITGRYVDVVKECPCTIIGYPNRWTRNICAPPHPVVGQWHEVTVVLSKSGKTLARQSVRFLVQ